MSRKFALLLALFVIWSIGHGTGVLASDSDDKAAAVEGNNRFAFNLYSQVKQNDGNLFISPFSISTALAMTYAGAGGNTQTQMAKTLSFSLSQDHLHPAFLTLMQALQADAVKTGYELSIANALWGQKGQDFHKAFIDITRDFYTAGFKQVDFVKDTELTRQTINGWVEEKTKDKIKELIKPGILTGFTRMVLTNAIYFKGQWMSQFRKKSTRPEPFELMGGESVAVPMMNQSREFSYAENKTTQILEMPYKGANLSMVVLLPKGKKGIQDLEDSLNVDNLKDWLSVLREQEVVVFLPKFKMTSGFLLNEALKSLGMTDAFDAGLADFSGMTPNPAGLYISDVIHKAFVDVNEEGTEAAAATAVVMRVKAAFPESMVVFRADHPFVFIIRDVRSGSILFIGRVMDPR